MSAKKKYQLPMVIVALGLGYGGYLFYVFSNEQVPLLEHRLAEQEATLTGKKNELSRLRNFSQNIEAIKVSLRELNLQLDAALESMPRNYDMSGLLRKLSVIGFNTGIRLSAFRPWTEGKKEGFYESMPISFNVAGSFTQVLSFLDQALRLKRVIRIDKVSLRGNGEEKSRVQQSGVLIIADVSAKVFRFVE